MRYARLFRQFFRTCLVEEFEYRANFAANLLLTVFGLAMAVLSVQLFFYRTAEIGGWGFYEVLALLGMFNAVHGLIEFYLQPNMSRLVGHIRQGTLDYVLTKPIDSQFYISFRHLVFWRLMDVALGFGLMGYALWKNGTLPSTADLALFGLFFISAMAVVYALWMGMMTFSFWAVKVDNLSYLFHSFFETARFPVTVYQAAMRFVLTYVFPVAFITTVPVEALLGRLHWTNGLAALAVGLLFMGLCRLFWRFALRHYTSASS